MEDEDERRFLRPVALPGEVEEVEALLALPGELVLRVRCAREARGEEEPCDEKREDERASCPVHGSRTLTGA